MAENRVAIVTPEITLDAFLKWAGVSITGGQAKLLIVGGQVSVNGETELRRGRKLHPGDRVEIQGSGCWVVDRRE